MIASVSWPSAFGAPAKARLIVLTPAAGLMTAPACPHENCGWIMPQLCCPDHGNYGMTFLFARHGCLTHVHARLDLPFPVPLGETAGAS